MRFVFDTHLSEVRSRARVSSSVYRRYSHIRRCICSWMLAGCTRNARQRNDSAQVNRSSAPDVNDVVRYKGIHSAKPTAVVFRRSVPLFGCIVAVHAMMTMRLVLRTQPANQMSANNLNLAHIYTHTRGSNAALAVRRERPREQRVRN